MDLLEVISAARDVAFVSDHRVKVRNLKRHVSSVVWFL